MIKIISNINNYSEKLINGSRVYILLKKIVKWNLLIYNC